MDTLAIHVIWTTYMTWPPGDPRGHWSPLFDVYGRLRGKGSRLNPPDKTTRQHAHRVARGKPVHLTPVQVGAIASTLGALRGSIAPGMPGAKYSDAKPVANLRIHAAAIEPTHVHLLLAPLPTPIGRVVGRIKSTTARAALSVAPNAAVHRRTWTAGYWKTFLFDEDAVSAVKGYIESHNLRRGLPAAPWPWIAPCT